MPVKNAGDFLKPCLDSIVNQTESEWELIAVNDASVDDSAFILKEYARDDSRIKVLESKGSGIIDALITGYNASKGDLIHRMDADDIMPSTKLLLLKKNLQKGSVSTGKVEYFKDGGQVGDGFLTYSKWLNGLWNLGNGWVDIYKECPIASPAWMIHRGDFDRIGGFCSDELPEDYDLAFRIYQNRLQVNWVNEIVHKWRDSESRTSRNNQEYFPTAYYPLKVKKFLEIDRDHAKPLLLWGAGKKGKYVARLLQQNGEKFQWATNNSRKTGAPIYDVKLKLLSELNPKDFQNILVVSGPSDKTDIQAELDEQGLKIRQDYFWFC